MHLRNLPDDILCLVFKRSLESRKVLVTELKANLPLLAVCQRWRRLLAPIVHSSVAIQYGSEPSEGSNDTNGKLEDAKLLSNLDLVVAAGCLHMVKSVVIAVHCEFDPFPGLTAVVQLMRAAADEWKCVETLCIAVHHDEDVLYSFDPDLDDSEDNIKQTGAALAATMPMVRHIRYRGSYTNYISQGILGQIAAHYADQLQSISSRHPIAVPPDCTFRQLRDSCIANVAGDSYQHPRVDPANIVSLRLPYFSANHSWAPFSAGGDSRTIEFLRMKEMVAVYPDADMDSRDEAPHRDGQPWVLRFPALETLFLFCMHETCPLLEYAVLPPRMDRVIVKAVPPVILRMSRMSLPVARRLEICIQRGPDRGPEALVAASRILSNARGSKELVLDVGDVLLTVVPDVITCTSLTELVISSRTYVSSALELIRKLPALTRLEIGVLSPDNAHEDISLPAPDNDCRVEPFDTKIAILRIRIGQSVQDQKALVPVVKYLLLKTPTLTRVCMDGVPETQIVEFVDAYSEQYPHLAGIALEFSGQDN